MWIHQYKGYENSSSEGKGVCAVSHAIAVASSLLWRLLLSTFVHLGSFFTFLDKKDIPLLPYCRLLCSLCFSKAGVKVEKLAEYIDGRAIGFGLS